jgi:hypothetical protein
MAMIIFRKFSACFSSVVRKVIFESFVTPSTSSATSFPNSFSIVSRVTPVSSNAGVFDGVVKEARHDRREIEVHLGERERDLGGVDDVGIAARALLLSVRLLGELVRLVDRLHRRVREVGAHGRLQLLERLLGFGQTELPPA